jgi:RND family efflux transporter MFP subunit
MSAPALTPQPGAAAPGRFPVRWAALGVAVLVAGGLFAFSRLNGKAAAAGGAHGREGDPAPVAPAPQEVTVETVVARPLAEPIRVTGTLRTDETVTLSTKATGLVRSVAVREGDRVRRGQLLVVVDDSDLRAQRDRAVAAARAADSRVKEAEAFVRVAEAKVQQARTNRGIKDTAADSDYRRAQQALATAQSRLSQAKAQAEITGTEAESRVSGAKANLQATRERLKALQDGSRRQEKATAEAQVARAQTQVARTRSQLERREALLKEKAIAAEAVDNARRDHEAALADLDAARQQLSLVQEGPRGEEVRAQEEAVRQLEGALRDAEANRARTRISSDDVAAAESQVRQAEAALEAAKAALEQKAWNSDEIRSAEASLAQARAGVFSARAAAIQTRADIRYQDELIAQTRIHSPVNGVVTKRLVQTGAAVVQMRNELMTLVSSDTLFFEATAPETSLPMLRPGLPARVMLDALPGRIFPGSVREIIPVAEGNNRSVRLRISIPRAIHSSSVVGGFARAEIRGESRGDGISIPREAIVSDEGETAVFVEEQGKARRVAITIGDPGGTGGRVPVIRGLRGGERVIVEGASGLTDGQAVAAGG